MEVIKLTLPDGDILDFQIAFVNEPATESSFMTFKKKTMMKFKEVDKSRRIVMGYFMISEMEIDRYDPEKGAYKVKFEGEAIDKIVENWAINGLNKNMNENHQTNEFTPGAYVISQFQIDSKIGQLPPEGFKVEADRSWFGYVKCQNEEVYQKCLDGTYNGFSVESVFVENKFAKLDAFLSTLKVTSK
jgi:hypothetical protein